MEILRFGDTTTSEFLSKISFKKFERFEVPLLNSQDRENPYEVERERERERESTRCLKILILNGLLIILYVIYIYFDYKVYLHWRYIISHFLPFLWILRIRA